MEGRKYLMTIVSSYRGGRMTTPYLHRRFLRKLDCIEQRTPISAIGAGGVWTFIPALLVQNKRLKPLIAENLSNFLKVRTVVLAFISIKRRTAQIPQNGNFLLARGGPRFTPVISKMTTRLPAYICDDKSVSKTLQKRQLLKMCKKMSYEFYVHTKPVVV